MSIGEDDELGDEDTDDEESGETNAARSLTPTTRTSDSEPPVDKGLELAVIQYLWVGLGVLFLLAHAYGTQQSLDVRKPVSDGVTLAFLGFIVVGLLLDRVSEFKFAGGGLKFKEEKAAVEAVRSTEKIRWALNDYSNLLQSWVNSASLLNSKLQEADAFGEKSVINIVTRFCLERMEEARDIVALRNETVRVSIWWFFEQDLSLGLILSSDIEDEHTRKRRFALGEGLMGEAFIESRMYNIDDAPASPYFSPTPHTKLKYKGLMLVPIRIKNKDTVGMVSIDRTKALEFDSAAENVGWALADMIALAYSHPVTRKYVAMMPTGV